MATQSRISHVDSKTSVAVFGALVAIAISFALYTNHAWEDYYITYRSSKHLALGHGLVFSPGEKLHVFTSPFNVLLPALCSFITGNTSDNLALWLYRILCCLALGSAGVLLFKIARKNSLSLFATIILLCMFGLSIRIIDFSINGQETAFMMLFLALTLYALTVPSRFSAVTLGVAWAGLMWTRPDGFIYGGALSVAILLFLPDQSAVKSRLEVLKIFLIAGCVTTVLYLPWFAGAWWYFGSPVPHPVVARGVNMPDVQPLSILKNFLLFPFSSLRQRTSFDGTFAPINAEFFGGWPHIVIYYSRYLSWFCAFYWLLPSVKPRARAVSFAFMSSHFYLSHIAPHANSWYIPNCTFSGVIVFAYIVQHGLRIALSLRGKFAKTSYSQFCTACIRIFAKVIVALTFVLFLVSAYQIRIQQQVIEEGHRKQMGIWLREHAVTPQDTVFLEPLGYIGYFSQLKMYDFPGLSSPEVVAARKKLGTDDWAQLIPELRPDWLVLRPYEARDLYDKNPSFFNQHYSVAKIFDTLTKLESYPFLPGRDYFIYDHIFMIFRRNDRVVQSDQGQ